VRSRSAEERQRITGLKNKGFINGNGCEKDPLLTGLNGVPGKKGSEIPLVPEFTGKGVK
jgi:hypothetical protein